MKRRRSIRRRRNASLGTFYVGLAVLAGGFVGAAIANRAVVLPDSKAALVLGTSAAGGMLAHWAVA